MGVRRSGQHATPRRQPGGRGRFRTLAGALALIAGGVVSAAPTPGLAFSESGFEGDQVRGRAFGAAGQVIHPGLDPVSTADDTSVSIGEVAVQSMSCNPALGSPLSKSAEELTSTLNVVGSLTVPLPNTTATLARSDELKQSGYATAEPTRADAFERSVVQKVNLLDGRITADIVQADAWTTHDARGYHHHSTSQDGIANEEHGPFTDPDNPWVPRTDSTFTNLFVDPDGPGGLAPMAMDPRVAPNTVIQLSGLGRVVLNEQRLAGTKYPNPLDKRFPKGAYSFSGVDVNAIHVYLVDDPTTAARESLAGYTGEITVAHAETRVQPAPGRLSGFAYGARGTVDPFLATGLVGIVGLPCGGTNGEPRNRTQGVTQVAAPSGAALTQLLRTGTISSTVKGLVKAGNISPYSESVEEIQTVRLLTDGNGVSRVSADLLRAVARTDGTAGGVTSSGAGTSFVNLVVDPDGSGPAAPIVVDQSPPPNTRIALNGLGVLILNEQNCFDQANPATARRSCTSLRAATPTEAASNTRYNGLTTYALHLRVTESPNDAGLPVGAEVFVGVSHSDVAF